MRSTHLILITIATLAFAACGDKNGDDDGVTQHDAAPADADPNAPDAEPGPSPDAAANSVTCGADACDTASEQCCVDQGGATCLALADTCGGTTLGCDGPEDCPGGTDVCCARGGGGGGGGGGEVEVACAAACNNGLVACHLDTDCAEGEHCCGDPDGYRVCLELPQCPAAP